MKYTALFAASLVSTATSFTPARPAAHTVRSSSSSSSLDASIQFVRGLEEKVIPDVKLTRARDGSSGVATFQFVSPNVFDASTQAQGEVTGMFMEDDEGELSTTDVNARFSNGKPQAIEATYVMKSPAEWDRFMRFSKSTKVNF